MWTDTSGSRGTNEFYELWISFWNSSLLWTSVILNGCRLDFTDVDVTKLLP